jgi:hypothetical protein
VETEIRERRARDARARYAAESRSTQNRPVRLAGPSSNGAARKDDPQQGGNP